MMVTTSRGAHRPGPIRSLLTVLAICLACGTGPNPLAANPLASPTANRADALFSELQTIQPFSGAVMFGDHGVVRYARAFGMADREAGARMTIDTPIDGASLAKPVTAAAILLLAHEGAIDLDAPVTRYLATYPDPRATVRHLLAHSAGLPDYGRFQTLLDAGAPVATSDLLASLGAEWRANSPPGSRYAYCSLCYDVLGLIIEQVSGLSFETFIAGRLLRPTGAARAFVRPARFSDWAGVRTRGYRPAGQGWLPHDAFDNEGFHGGSNIYFATRDLFAWASAWAGGSPPLDRLRRPATARAETGDGLSGLTLGNWICADGRTRCFYTGQHQGFHNFAYWNSETRVAVVFISNSTLSAHLQPRLARALVAIAEGEQIDRPFAPAPPGAAAPIAGRYMFPELGVVTIDTEGGQASARLAGGARTPLLPADDGIFFAPGLHAYLSFPIAAAGEAQPIEWISPLRSESGRRID